LEVSNSEYFKISHARRVRPGDLPAEPRDGRGAGRGFTLDELVSGGIPSKDHWPIGHLKFDPRSADPNYTYTLNAGEKNWEAKTTPKKPGLGGFYVVGSGMFPKVLYNPKGEASIASTETDGYSISGHTFKAD
jgi:hypothetical protein